MTEKGVSRKLTAILYADVADYSRLTGEDELGTHKRLSAALDLTDRAMPHFLDGMRKAGIE